MARLRVYCADVVQRWCFSL